MDLEVQDFQSVLGVSNLLRLSDGGEHMKDGREGETRRREPSSSETLGPNYELTRLFWTPAELMDDLISADGEHLPNVFRVFLLSEAETRLLLKDSGETLSLVKTFQN